MQPQQLLLKDTISVEPCPQSSPQTDWDILELLQDSAPKDNFLENSEGIQDSILHYAALLYSILHYALLHRF